MGFRPDDAGPVSRPGDGLSDAVTRIESETSDRGDRDGRRAALAGLRRSERSERERGAGAADGNGVPTESV